MGFNDCSRTVDVWNDYPPLVAQREGNLLSSTFCTLIHIRSDLACYNFDDIFGIEEFGRLHFKS